jgi:hypothetical protein
MGAAAVGSCSGGVIFGQLVNDPGFQQGRGFKYSKNKKEAAVERKRLFGIIEELVKWESTTGGSRPQSLPARHQADI